MTRPIGSRRERALIAQVAPPSLTDTAEPKKLSQAVAALATVTNQLADRATVCVVDATLVVGANTVTHTLGRAPSSVTITPYTAVATFVAGWNPTTVSGTKQVAIVVAGAGATCRIRLE